MKRVKVIILMVILWLGFVASVQGLTAGVVWPPEEIGVNQSINHVGRFALQDGIPYSETAPGEGSDEVVGQAPLCVRSSNDPQFEYMAASPYYKVFFKDTVMRMQFENTWIELGLPEQNLGEIMNTESVVQENALSVANVFESVDLSYTVGTSVLKEAFALKTSKDFDRIILEISWEGVAPVFEEDGSIVFLNETEKVVKILPPFMEDAENTVCTDIHYELVETETGYELHKVIDAKGLQWLKEAVYPVVIDPSMQVFEDAWESSGLQPYGQYFQNLKEYVNPANGHLTVTQIDLVIPGRGLDLAISRIYETPAVFYQAEPHEYVQPPVNVGKGWHLNFPWIGTEYLYLQNGTMYKIAWSQDTFENHEGAHFVLVKNLDSTYTLTTADGTVYEFSTAGKLTEIRDLDQNTITFNYSSGTLTSITDTIGRTVTLTYSDGRLQKIVYNSAEIEYGYSNGCLVWMDDFLNRRTSYSYNTGWYEWIENSPGCIQKSNIYLLSKIEYPTGGYTTYVYDRFSYEQVYGDDGTCLDYFKYYVTHQKVYETDQVRHSAYAYTGTFSGITSCVTTEKNESDVTKGSYHFSINSTGLIYQKVTKNASGTPMRKYTYTYNSKKECIQVDVYNDGSNLSYTNYYAYDNWGNCIYFKNAEGHEQFFSYANTDTSGFFIDNTGMVIRQFTNAFTNSSVPSSVHTILLGTAEKQDNTYVKETYLTYDSKAHPTQSENAFGNTTAWLTFSGTFNEKTGTTSFPIDLTGHTVTGNAVLQVTGLPSDDTYQENHSYGCSCNPTIKCTWTGGSWPNNYYRVHWSWCAGLECDNGWASVGPFTHYPGTLGYQSYSTNPPMGGKAHTITVTTNWKAYPVQVQYNVDGSSWETVTSNLQNQTVQIPVTITGGSHTLYLNESSSKQTTFSWYLCVPVDNAPDTYTTTMQYDTYGNVTSITDAESNTISFSYSPDYTHAYLTEISAVVGTDMITTKATYNYYRGWITSIQQPKGAAGSGYDYRYTYDVLGRITKKEFPLLPGQSQRSFLEAIYDDTNRTVTIIDQLRHYTVKHYDKLGRLTDTKRYTGTYGSGALYATMSYEYRYDDRLSKATDPGNDQITYSYDFTGRYTSILYPDSSSVSYSYDDTNNSITLTNGRGYDTVYWYSWLSRLEKVEEEYAVNLFTVTTYQYDEVGHVTSFTDAENYTTTYTYASLFGLTRTTYPDATCEQYSYDTAGNITTCIDANGNEITYSFDTLYRLTQIQYEDQSTVTFTYDLNSNRIKMVDNTSNTGDYIEYTYDSWDRLETETRYISQDSFTGSYQYDVASRLTRLTYPDDMEILYFYDDLNRMTEINRYIDGIHDEVLMSNAQYDAENVLTQVYYGNGLRATYSYDVRDRLSTVDIADDAMSFLDLDYTYDSNGNITQVVNGWRNTESDWWSDTEIYNYDGLDRLLSAGCASWNHTYSYDKAGNRTGKDSVAYTVNAVNEVMALSDGTFFSYDLNGNRTQKAKGTDTWDYTYDYANRLTKVEKNSTTLGEYVYDGDGRRLQVTENGEATTYIYSGLTVLFEENSAGTADYIYGPAGLFAKRTTINEESNTFYYHTDHLGSTRLVTDGTKNIVTAVTYHPFGEPDTCEGSEHYLFSGKQRDSTGIYYLGARYYDPELGRFLTRDPLVGDTMTPQRLNRYTYCRNNPLKYVDPWGEKDHYIEGGGEAEEEERGVNTKDAKEIPPPEYVLPYDEGYIGVETNIYKCGNVGVAIGYYNEPVRGGGFKEGEWGLVIFTFDGDEITDYVFISFDSIEDAGEGKYDDDLNYAVAFVAAKANAGDFGKALGKLEEFCRAKEKTYDKVEDACTWGGLVGTGLGLIAKYFARAVLGTVGIAVGIGVFAVGVVAGRMENIWGRRRDLIDTL
jgi:RHS repeat-associated protein